MATGGRRRPVEVASVLEREILDGHHAHGSRIPTEAELAARFAVSRSAVREAIAELRRAGLVTTQQGRGSFVAEELPAQPVFALPPRHLEPAELRQVYELRREVEAGAAALAALHAKAGDIGTMHEILGAMEADAERTRAAAAQDLALHQAIARATGNGLFTDFLAFFSARTTQTILSARAAHAQVSGRTDIVHREHQAIVEAIAAGEPEEARAAMRVHLTLAMRRLDLRHAPADRDLGADP